MWSRRNVVKSGVATIAMGLGQGGAIARVAGDKRPNILFIMADDLGVADLSCFGREDFVTPNLDRLAASGIALDRSYSNSSVCSPTRLALMTGRYQYRLPGGLDEPLGIHPELGLPPSQSTLPSMLKKAGYATSLVGKWHLGGLPGFGPLKSGYDRFFGIYQGGADYFSHGMTIGGKFKHDLWDGETEVHRQGYLTDLITERGIDEITRLSGGGNRAPFMLSVHYTAPHWPWEGPQDAETAKTIRDSFHYDGGGNPTYASMVGSLDRGVGKLLDALELNGLSNNTIVVFTSDNGGERFSKVWPFRGRKGELLEGGIRVPTLFSWPGHVTAGSRSGLTNITMDWAPTLIAAAGIDLEAADAFDGRNLLPDLEYGSTGPDRLLFWRHKAQGQCVAMRGTMKYLAMSGNEFLFDLANDPLEAANLKSVHPEVFSALKGEFAKWNGGMLPYPETSFSYELRGNGHQAGY